MKRIKHVFTNHHEVLHRWANQTQGDARCKNVFFNGKSVYSYGYHYELGRLINYKGVKLALINDAGYSTTTNRHIHSAIQSTAHYPTLRTKELSSVVDKRSLKLVIENALLRRQDEIIDSIFSVFNRHKAYSFTSWDGDPDFPQYSIKQSVSTFNNKCIQLGFYHLPLEIDRDFIGVYNEQCLYFKLRTAEINQVRASERELARLEVIAKGKAEIDTWKNNLGPMTHAVNLVSPQLIRIKGDKIETSSGATVPLSDAIRLLKAIKNDLNNELNSTNAVNTKVGPYQCDGIDGDIVSIGCHKISLKYAESILSNNSLLRLVTA